MAGTVEPESREESRLPTTDLTQIDQLVIRECCQCLKQAKELVIDCMEADWDRRRLESLPGVPASSQVRGALAMIPLPRAASLMRGCADYVDEQLMVN